MPEIHVPHNDPYGSVIKTLFVNEFPQINTNDKDLTLEYLTQAILATNQIRYGPMPKPEALVEIRKTIKNSVDKKAAIPILMPWGSRKTSLSGQIDIAELSALKTLACLNARVIRRYAYGIKINIRVEDASGNYLFLEDGEKSRVATANYVQSFVKLVRILGYDSFIEPILESNLFTEEQFKSTSGEIEPKLLEYILDAQRFGTTVVDKSFSSYRNLEAMGWKEGIPADQMEYYLYRYNALYPGITNNTAYSMMARYLAGAWARRKLNGYGDDPAWNRDYLRMTFAAPVPGAPGMYSKDIFYRTLPTKYGTTHIPPWRAKGYVAIGNDYAFPKVTSWSETKEYVPLKIQISNAYETVDIQSDYVLT